MQEKLEKLIDKHMRSIGASKVSLSSISSEELWRRSGRFQQGGELMRIKDRKSSGFLLSPTHEEEITMLVARNTHSYKDFPLRLYQVSRKYRDERRPRQGLLRAKEFLMKDLYTFDYSEELALQTYDSTRKAYAAFFDELGIPYIVANADTGNMGGKLSHEYHFVSEKGEDNVISCNTCDYVANEELAEKGKLSSNVRKIPVIAENMKNLSCWSGVNHARDTIYKVWTLKPTSKSSSGVNIAVLKRHFPEIDFSVDNIRNLQDLKEGHNFVEIYDRLVCPGSDKGFHGNFGKPLDINDYDPFTSMDLDLASIQSSDPCPKCSSGQLNIQRAIEVGHTFHLGTRYSEPLEATIQLPADSKSNESQIVPLQMGCHGIGISRLIGAAASLLSDRKGLNWPLAIAPFHVIVVFGRTINETEAIPIYDTLSKVVLPQEGTATEGEESASRSKIDVLLDDRTDKDLIWKLQDADRVGYPIIVVLGRGWKDGKVEVQCRRANGFKDEVEVDKVRDVVGSLLKSL